MRYLALGEVVELHRPLILNGSEIDAPVDDQEHLILDLARHRLRALISQRARRKG
jgi:hypothetical protein